MEPSPSVVRTATPEDRDDVWRLLLQSHSENGIFKLDPVKVDHLVNRALYAAQIPPWDQGPRAHIGVIGPPGKLEAIVFLMIGSFWYSSDLHLEELLIFVDPEYRRSEHAKSIIAWMKKTAQTLGIPVLTGIISKHRTAAKIRLYDRYLPRVGAFFLFPMDEKSDIRKMNRMDYAAYEHLKSQRKLQ